MKTKHGIKVQSLLKELPVLAPLAEVLVENTTISLPEVPDYKFPVRIYRPNRPHAERLPVMLWFHGGYWCSGDANSEDFGCRAVVARGADVIVVSFEYRLIPEVEWHVQLSDAENAMKWVAANAASIGGDVSKGFVIGGAEAGSQIAGACAVRARNRHPNIKITGQNLIVPITCAGTDSKMPKRWLNTLTSHEENKDSVVFDERMFQMFVDALKMPEDEQRNGENFPLWTDPKGLPPAYLAMDECDPIRDHAWLYTDLLREAGVLTRTDYYRGLPNMFVHYPQIPDTARAGWQQSAAVRWLLDERK